MFRKVTLLKLPEALSLTRVDMKSLKFGGSLTTNSRASKSRASEDLDDAQTLSANPSNVVQLWS